MLHFPLSTNKLSLQMRMLLTVTDVIVTEAHYEDV